jgi:hypothetical protein
MQTQKHLLQVIRALHARVHALRTENRILRDAVGETAIKRLTRRTR